MSAALSFSGVLSSEQPMSATDKNMASSRCLIGNPGFLFVGIALVIAYSRPNKVISKSLHPQDEQQHAPPHESDPQSLGCERPRLRWRVGQEFRHLPARHE